MIQNGNLRRADLGQLRERESVIVRSGGGGVGCYSSQRETLVLNRPVQAGKDDSS